VKFSPVRRPTVRSVLASRGPSFAVFSQRLPSTASAALHQIEFNVTSMEMLPSEQFRSAQGCGMKVAVIAGCYPPDVRGGGSFQPNFWLVCYIGPGVRCP